MEYIFKIQNFLCAVSGRISGDMKYESGNPNRLALFKKFKLNPCKVYGLNQIHSRNVLAVDGNNPPDKEADGMITNDKSITLSVTVADCLPVFLMDPASGAFGIVHSGWKGTGIAVTALNLMKKAYGVNAHNVTAVLGPCIGSCCYKVDKERASFFENNFGSQSVRKDSQDFFLDLRQANVNLLKEAGVRNIEVSRDCTFCDERYGSFRREGKEYTRMIALVTRIP